MIKQRWIRWIRKISFEIMISVIILTTKSQGFSPFGGSESLKESPPPVWMVPMSHALGLRGFNARINCTWRWHQFGADESNYGTSHPDCGSIQRWQQKSIFFDKVYWPSSLLISWSRDLSVDRTFQFLTNPYRVTPFLWIQISKVSSHTTFMLRSYIFIRLGFIATYWSSCFKPTWNMFEFWASSYILKAN